MIFLIISKGKYIWLTCWLAVEHIFIRPVSSVQKLEVAVMVRRRGRMYDRNSVIELSKDYLLMENRNQDFCST